MQYMVAEVQYGGRITDGEDRNMFLTYAQLWVNDGCLQQNYCFNQQVTERNPSLIRSLRSGKSRLPTSPCCSCSLLVPIPLV
jgi:hypothetical protein